MHYWADLQSVHRLRYYGNITRTQNVSEYVLVLALCLVFDSDDVANDVKISAVTRECCTYFA